MAAPLVISSWTMAKWSEVAAQWRGVCPVVSMADISVVLLARSKCAMFRCSVIDAIWSGVS